LVWIVKTVGVALVVLYVESYSYLLRRGMQEAKEWGGDGFLYVPFDEAVNSKDLTRHQYLRLLYTPLNKIDQLALGADEPVICILFDLE
jgi:hypothetical protein